MNTFKESITSSKLEIITTITPENLVIIIDKFKKIALSKPTGAVFTSGPTALGMSTISKSSRGVSEFSEQNIINNER